MAASTRVRLHPLRCRRDGNGWVVGRAAGGRFVVVPAVAMSAIRLLDSGLSPAGTQQRLQAELGVDVDVGDFVGALRDLGFVAAVDDVPLADTAQRATWPGLAPRHVRWLVSGPALLFLAAVLLAGGLTAVAVPGTIPRYQDLLWSPHTGVVLAGNAALAWSMIFLHELAHLATARAYGVPGRLSLGTRLQFLAVQTDVSAIWAAPRRARVVVYLSGIAVHLAVAGLALVGRAATGQADGAGRVLGAVVILAVAAVAYQLLVFMRTDLYFLLQDLTGAHDLYADGSAYLRWWGRGRPGRGPLSNLAPAERRAVRVYAAGLTAGTAACLAFAATVSLPVAAELVARTASTLLSRPTGAATLDAVLSVLVVAGLWILWARAWWKRHGRRVRAWTERRR